VYVFWDKLAAGNLDTQSRVRVENSGWGHNSRAYTAGWDLFGEFRRYCKCTMRPVFSMVDDVIYGRVEELVACNRGSLQETWGWGFAVGFGFGYGRIICMLVVAAG